jgi:hypothetical protein
MSFAWILFLLAALVANLLLISIEFFGITVSPSHTADASEHTDVKGPERFMRFSTMFLIQALLVVVTIAMIAHYVYFARHGETSFASLWVLALLVFAYPLFQIWRMGGTRENAPLDSVSAKFVSYLAIPVTVLIAFVGTMLFVFGTVSVSAFFYPLVLLGAVIVAIGAVSAITGGRAVERISTDADHRNDARHVH